MVACSMPAQGMLKNIANRIKGAASSVTPTLEVTLTTDAKNKIDETINSLKDITAKLTDKFEKVLQGSNHLQKLIKMQENLNVLVNKVSQEAQAKASNLESKHNAESETLSSHDRKENSEDSGLINTVKKDLQDLSNELSAVITDFTASIKKDDKKSSEQNADTLLANKLQEFKGKLHILIQKLSTQSNNQTLGSILQELKVIKEECDVLVKTFKEQSLGGLYGALEANIKELGKILDKTVTSLSTKFSRQMSIELRQMIGFPVLQLLLSKMNNEMMCLQNLYSVNKADYVEKFEDYESIACNLVNSIKNAENPGILETSLSKLAQIIQATKQKYNQIQGSSLQASIVTTDLRIITSEINVIITSNGGFNAMLSSNIAAFKDSMNQVFDRVLEKLKQELPEISRQSAQQVANEARKLLKKEVPEATEKIAQTGLSYFKKGALYVTSLALAAYSTYYLMNNHDNPIKTKIGLGVLAGSLVYPVIDRAAALWSWLTVRKK